MGRYKAYVKRTFYSNIKSLDRFYRIEMLQYIFKYVFGFFPTKNYHSVRFFVVRHQTVQLSIGGAKNIFDLEYDFECANMPLLLQNVTTCLQLSVVYALKHFERSYNILLRTSGGQAC